MSDSHALMYGSRNGSGAPFLGSEPHSTSRTLDLRPNSSVCGLLDSILEGKIVHPEEWQELPGESQFRIRASNSRDDLLSKLTEHQLLTSYQFGRMRAGTTFGLVLGNYRVLDRIGAGGMGIVFKAEHILMRRIVAIKVLPVSRDQDNRLLMRFLSEMRSIAALQHPNIVAAMDAGSVTHEEPNLPVLHYLVMEYVIGSDLDGLIENQGPLDVMRASDLIHQIASALDAAHASNMVHRDLKPSNIIVTAENRAKLLDFGLARNFQMQLTEPGCLLGTLEYMAPEQAIDATNVDIRADIYGLGGCFYFALTGEMPFPPKGGIAQELNRRRTGTPPSVRAKRPDLPASLDAVIAKMLAPNADDRFPNPKTVMHALEPFLRSHALRSISASVPGLNDDLNSIISGDSRHRDLRRVIVIDDDPSIRNYCRAVLANESIYCDEAEDGKQALAMIEERCYDVALLDLEMPEMPGTEVLRRIRTVSHDQNIRIIMISGGPTPDELAQLLMEGADDYLTTPFSVAQFKARVQGSLRLKTALDHACSMNRHMQKMVCDLESDLHHRDTDLASVRNGLVLGLASIVGHRTTETEGHLKRIQKYCRVLAENAAQHASFSKQIDANFIRSLECCAPLHDIGVVALPDHILIKPGKLTAEERVIVEAHTLIGSEILQKVKERHGSSMMFLQTAVELARSHHERYDGHGYPDQIKGDSIPLASRILAICDVYDALRSRRPYRPGLSHNGAVQVITRTSAGQFDPGLLEIFTERVAEFETIFSQIPD